MERKIKFIPEEHYHVFSRGVEKRKIFLDTNDYERFMSLLFIINQKQHFHVSNFLNKGKKKVFDLYKEEKSENLVSILAFSLMPNHFHIVIRENEDGGISKFMMKLLTAYSMYFNKKNERSGPLFVHPFRSEHISDDVYFRHIFSYVHLNCLDLIQKNWKQEGISNLHKSQKFMKDYRYSSYPDFIYLKKDGSRREAVILDKTAIPDSVSRATLDITEFDNWYSKGLNY